MNPETADNYIELKGDEATIGYAKRSIDALFREHPLVIEPSGNDETDLPFQLSTGLRAEPGTDLAPGEPVNGSGTEAGIHYGS